MNEHSPYPQAPCHMGLEDHQGWEWHPAHQWTDPQPWSGQEASERWCVGRPALFRLERDEDETGVSGTGTVAFGTRFPDGTAVLRWTTHTGSTGVYNSISDIETIHGHNGRTRIVWEDS